MEEVNIKAKLISYSIVALFILVLFLSSVSGFNNLNNNPEDRAIISFPSNLVVGYDVEVAQQEITPIETKLEIDLYIDYQVVPGDRLLHNLIFRLYEGNNATINLEIDTASLPDFVSASLTRKQVSVKIFQELIRAIEPVNLVVSVSEDAPAFIDFYVKIKASAPEIIGRFGFTKINGATAYTNIRLTPNYTPLIKFEEPKGNYMEIGPADTAEFPIKVTNLGNAPTEVTFEILNFPTGWSLNIQETIILPSATEGGEPTETAILRIKPKPQSIFGYPNERQTIQVKLTSSYYRNPNLTGKSYILNFIVDLKGDLEQNIALIIIILVIIISVILIFIIIYKYYKSKSINVRKV